MNKRDIWDEIDELHNTDSDVDANSYVKEDSDSGTECSDLEAEIERIEAEEAARIEPEIISDLDKKLFNVIDNNQHELIQSLVDEGADVNKKTRFRYYPTPLTTAAGCGYDKCLKSLLEAGADPNNVDENNISALIYAAKVGNEEIVNMLINAGADIEIASSVHNTPLGLNNTPLMFAIKGGHHGCVKLLLNAGANYNMVSKNGKTLLMLAAERRQKMSVQFLLDSGADIKMEKNNGWTALFSAAKIPFLSGSYSEKEQNNESLEYLIEKGADIEKELDNGQTPLIIAAGEGVIMNVNMLLKAGADINHRDKKGNTPLIHAVFRGHDDCVFFLLEAGADINNVNSNNNTALMIAKDKVTESAENCCFSDDEDYYDDDEYNNEKISVWQNYTDCVGTLEYFTND